MGWKSTIDLTRQECEEAIASELGGVDNLDKYDDSRLCDLLELLMGGEDHGANYRIVPEGYKRGDNV